jgi:hypothetical protein
MMNKGLAEKRERVEGGMRIVGIVSTYCFYKEAIKMKSTVHASRK